MNKLHKVLIPIFLLFSLCFGATSCIDLNDEMEDDGPCSELRESRYKDLVSTQFTVNGSETFYQNYTPYSYKDNPSKTSDFAKLWETQGAEGRIELHFTRIDFDDECTPFRKHLFTVFVEIDQLPTESKTYDVGSIANPNAKAYAFYTSGEALEEGELIRNTGNDAGTVTIDKWISGNRLTGSFDININGILVVGSFDYDLTSDYLDL